MRCQTCETPLLLSKEYKQPEQILALRDWPKIRRKAGFRVSEHRQGRRQGRVRHRRGPRPGPRHAVRLAQEGADIIAVDICKPIDERRRTGGDTEPTSPRPPSWSRSSDRRIVAAEVDVRDSPRCRRRSTAASTELGRLDIVVANAGIGTSGPQADEIRTSIWQDMIDVNLTGVWKTVKAGVPHHDRGRQRRLDHHDQLGRRHQGHCRTWRTTSPPSTASPG